VTTITPPLLATHAYTCRWVSQKGSAGKPEAAEQETTPPPTAFSQETSSSTGSRPGLPVLATGGDSLSPASAGPALLGRLASITTLPVTS